MLEIGSQGHWCTFCCICCLLKYLNGLLSLKVCHQAWILELYMLDVKSFSHKFCQKLYLFLFSFYSYSHMKLPFIFHELSFVS